MFHRRSRSGNVCNAMAEVKFLKFDHDQSDERRGELKWAGGTKAG